MTIVAIQLQYVQAAKDNQQVKYKLQDEHRMQYAVTKLTLFNMHGTEHQTAG